MSNPVSIIKWFDAKENPPKGDMDRRILAVHEDGTVQGCDAYYLEEEDYILWAEIPKAPTKESLTEDDLEEAWVCMSLAISREEASDNPDDDYVMLLGKVSKRLSIAMDESEPRNE